MELWQDVLGLDEVGVNDNFFDLGGHSLNVLQVISRMQSAFDLELPLASLFKSPTIGTLAEYIETVNKAKAMFKAVAMAEGFVKE